MKKYLVIILCFLLILELSGCVEDSTSNGELESVSIAISQDIMGFYPWVKSYELYTLLVNRNIYNSLVEFDDIFRLNPGLAKSWNNPDNLTWRFYLRENVTFHNGYRFTSNDVKYTIDLIRQNESKNNQLKELLKLVTEVNIIDDYTIDIKTIKPCPILLNLLTDIFIVSKQYQEETQTQRPVGTGAYILVDYVKNNFIHFESYDNYWKKPLPEIKNATFKIIKDYKNRTKAFIDQEVDIAQIDQKYLDNNNSIDYSVKKMDNPTIAYISFDFRENNSVNVYSEKNPLSDVRVRKAIYQAINIDEMISNYSGVLSPSSQFIIPLVFGYNTEIKRLLYDLENAQQLMKDAGYENGFEVIFDYSHDVFSRASIEYIKRQLSEIKINVTIKSLSYEEYISKLIANNCSIYANCWTTGTGDGGEIYDYLIGTNDEEKDIGLFNVGYYSNPEVDRLGENASVCMKADERQKLLQECFRIAMEDVAWIPLFTWKVSYGINNHFDWNPRADQQILVEDIEIKNSYKL